MRITLTLTLILIFIASDTLTSQEAIAMRSKTKGFSINPNAAFLVYTSNDLIHANTQSGIGFGGQLQFGFSHQIAVALGYQSYTVNSAKDYVSNSPYPYKEIDLLFKYYIGSTSSAFRSNVVGIINYVQTEQSFYDEFGFYYETFYTGFSFGFGAGFGYFITPQLSADLALFYHSTLLTNQEQNGFDYEIDWQLSSYKGLLGLTYHF